MIKIKLPLVELKNRRTRKKHHKRHHKRNTSSRSRRRSFSRRIPKGNWLETARNVKIVKRNLLQAELKDRKGKYVLATTYFRRGDIFENVDGSFVLVSNDYNSSLSRKTFNSKYYSRYHHGKYNKDNFNVYFNNKKTDISVLSFEDLGHGYAKDAFNVYYKGNKIDGAFHLRFQVLGKDYAKDPFNVYKGGKKIPNKSPFRFNVF